MTSSKSISALNRYDVFKELQKKPIIPNKSYPLNKDNVKAFLSELKEPKKSLAEIIFKNTKHVSYKVFKYILNSNFKEFIHYCRVHNIKSVALFLGQEEINKKSIKKSNFWVAQHFYQFVKKFDIDIEILIIYNKDDIANITKDQIVLILDDCSYTGSQISSEINYSLSSLQLQKFNIYVLIAFISKNAMDYIKNCITSKKIIFSKNNIIINPISHYLSKDQIKKYNKIYKLDSHYPIYFDHKLADTLSTFTDLYSGVVTSKNIIPVISNCEHINKMKDVNYDVPKCPPPPYKINSSDGFNKKDFKEYSSNSNNKIINGVKSASLNKRKISHRFLSDYKNRQIAKRVSKSLFKSPNKQHDIMRKNKLIILKSFIDKLNIPPLIPVKSYEITDTNVNKFIKKYNITKTNEKKLLAKIVKHIIHVTYDIFHSKLYECFDEFVKYITDHNIKLVTIIINTKNIYTSSFWIAQNLFHYLKEKSIKLDFDFIESISNINTTDGHYLILDDCLYNDAITYHNLNKIKPTYNFFIISPYVTNKIFQFLSKNKKTHLFKSVVFNNINFHLTTTEDNLMVDSDILESFNNIPLIYFDHNINIYNTPTINDDLIIEDFVDSVIPSIYLKAHLEKYSARFKQLPPIPEKKKEKTPEKKKEKTPEKKKEKTPEKKKEKTPEKKKEKTPEKKDKKCPEGKILNPKTGRCIIDRSKTEKKKEKTPEKKKDKTPEKKDKKCPEGKILNPKTGRCIIDRSKIVKKEKKDNDEDRECPRGSYLNPSSDRCKKITTSTKMKTVKDKNTCPKQRRPVNNKCVSDDYKVLKLNKQNYECCYKK
jgi:hypothetical protein